TDTVFTVKPWPILLDHYRSAYQTIQENMLKGGISGRSARGKRIHTRAIHSIDTDIKLNRALWVMAETMLESLR
ncbi:hypothetical protein HC634_22990, partial [Escherichia coli]|nr:hypothetical protein [Escherichia coli]